MPYAAAPKMRKEQTRPEMAQSLASKDRWMHTITKAGVWPLTVLGPGWQILMSGKERRYNGLTGRGNIQLRCEG